MKAEGMKDEDQNRSSVLILTMGGSNEIIEEATEENGVHPSSFRLHTLKTVAFPGSEPLKYTCPSWMRPASDPLSDVN